MRKYMAALLALVPLAASAQTTPPDPLPQLDAVVADAMETFQVPGIAVGVVKDGRILKAKGYGVRAAGTDQKVGPDTLFTIGTNTKQFTAAALSLLVDEGRLSWDDRVVDRLPQFRLYDPYVTREFRVRDLISHRSGLAAGAGNLIIYPETDFTRSEVFDALAGLPPRSGFRSRYAYSNLAYIAAGELIPAVTGISWDDFVQRRLLDRLGMARCTASGGSGAEPNAARPHAIVEGRLQPVRTVAYTMSAAANGVWCDVDGLSKWVAMQLDEGRLADGGKLMSPAQLREMWSIQIPSAVPPTSAQLHRTRFRGYGLGWNLEDFEGRLRVFHTGGVLGQVSQISLFPEARLGIIVLTNQRSTAPVNAITLHIAKTLLGASQQDWVRLYEKVVAGQRAEAAAAQAELAEALAEAGEPPLPRSAYVGAYRDRWRGDAAVSEVGGRLQLAFSRTGRLAGRLHYLRNDTFVVRWADRSLGEDAFVRFRRDAAGRIGGMTLEGLPSSEGDVDFENLAFARVSIVEAEAKRTAPASE